MLLRKSWNMKIANSIAERDAITGVVLWNWTGVQWEGYESDAEIPVALRRKEPDPVEFAARVAFESDEQNARELRFQRDKAEAGIPKVSRFQLRRAALRDSPAMLVTLDQSVVDSTDKSFKLKWDEHCDFSRDALNNTTLTNAQKNALFAAALLE